MSKTARRNSLLPSFILTTGVLLGCALGMSGCGAGSSSVNTNPGNPQPSKTAVQINMGDAPSDWMLAFSMNISSMSLTGGDGTVTVVSSSTPMEMMHLTGTMQPLAMVSVPQGSYTGATITMGSATLTYMDPNTHALTQKTIAGPSTANVTFATPMNVSSTPMALSFDLDLAHSVTAGSGGSFAFAPVFHVTSGMQGTGGPMDYGNGGIAGMMGTCSGVSGNSFTMTSMQAAQSFTFMTNSSTTFIGGSMGSMAQGMTLMVDAILQADGSLMATRVQSMMNPSGMMGGGIVTSVTGQPATALTLVMQNGAGNGMMASYFSNEATVNIAGNATFTIDTANIDMSGLPFTPAFDPDHVYVGQSVMPASSSAMMSGGMGGGMGGMGGGGMMAGSITASQLYLEPQGLSGTPDKSIQPSATSTFTLTLPADSAFTTLTGASTITVFQQTATIVGGNAAIAGGTSIHAVGLLFYDSGKWKMVASRIGPN